MWKINSWEISGNTATLFSNGKSKLEVPVTDDIENMWKKQKEAKVFLEAFKKVGIEDNNIIGYLNFMLDDYVNFLDYDGLNFLTKKMQLIAETDQIDINNAASISALLTNLETGNVDDFYDELDKFKKYNQNYLNSVKDSVSAIKR